MAQDARRYTSLCVAYKAQSFTGSDYPRFWQKRSKQQWAGRDGVLEDKNANDE